MITNNKMGNQRERPSDRLPPDMAGQIHSAANRIYRGDGVPGIPAADFYTPGDMPGKAGRKEDIADDAWPQRQTDAYYFMANNVNSAYGGYPAPYNIAAVRSDFPLLKREVNGHPLIWMDNAATTQKPKCVIDALSRYYSNYNSNIHRGAHELARKATDAYEGAREKIGKFIGASSRDEVVFVRGTTEAINLAANSWGLKYLRPDDEIILTEMEHHSNIVPWQMLAQKTGAIIKVAPVNDCGEIILREYERLFTRRTRLVSAAHVSNVLGTVNPVRQLADIAHWYGALILVDGAQSVPHMPVNVGEMGADFFAFSGHKMYGPTGIGVLYGRKELLSDMPPYQGGGGMIDSVSFDKTVYKGSPDKFEAGTANIADAVGLGAAVRYLEDIGPEKIRQYESFLTEYLMRELQKIPGLRLIGTAREKTSVVSFIIDGVSPDIIAKYLDQHGIAIRAGHHCAQPVLAHFGLETSARASIGIYNTVEEMDTFAAMLRELVMKN
jgi:cysteine desulfurase/selenocysteine lyase